jgi:hypothetical protein
MVEKKLTVPILGPCELRSLEFLRYLFQGQFQILGYHQLRSGKFKDGEGAIA